VSAVEQRAKASPEQAMAGMDLWMSWSKKAGSAIVDLGAPLGNPIKVAGGSSSKSDSNVTGFSILQADSSKSIVDLMKDHPHFKAPGPSITVLESLPKPGSPHRCAGCLRNRRHDSLTRRDPMHKRALPALANAISILLLSGLARAQDVDVPGNLTMVDSTAMQGNVLKGGVPFLHNFGVNN